MKKNSLGNWLFDNKNVWQEFQRFIRKLKFVLLFKENVRIVKRKLELNREKFIHIGINNIINLIMHTICNWCILYPEIKNCSIIF